MKTTNQGEYKNKIEFEIKDLNLDERCEFNTLFATAKISETNINWSAFVKCCLMVTDFTEETLNELTDIDIINVASKCYLVVNKKKLKK